MVDAAARTTGRARDWGFHEEPPAPGVTTGTTGKPAAAGWGNEAVPAATGRPRPAHTLLLDLSALAAAGATRTTPSRSSFDAITGASRTFGDATSLGEEVLRLKAAAAAPGQGNEIRAALRQQIVMRQAEWVTRAKAEGLPEPRRCIDPIRATPSEVAAAFLWSEAGGTLPRDELARDGGKAFVASVRDAVVYQTSGLDALLALHDGHPDEQRALLAQELPRRGIHVPEGATLDALRALEGEHRRSEDAHRPTMGLDGRLGTAEDVATYERDEALAAANPGTTLGSLMATYGAALTGDHGVERMRASGQAGNAVEGTLGGVGVHLRAVTLEREPPVATRNHDDFNRTGLTPKFRLKPMDAKYVGENLPGDNIWNRTAAPAIGARRPFEVKYAERASSRAAYAIEARPVMVDGKREMRLVDASGKLFDTRNATAHDGAQRAIFVMNAQGDLYASTFQEATYVHHSSLSGGQPVAAAGELIVENGRVTGITNRSGHYRPEARYTEQVIEALRQKGLDLGGVQVTTEDPVNPFAPKVRVLE